MTDSTSTIESWDSYWRGASDGAAYSSGGSSHPVVLSFWDTVFRAIDFSTKPPRIIDIASGSGAVVESAKSACGGQLQDFTCVDISASAVQTLQQRFPGIHGLIADAACIPLESAQFDIATSQFGIEYAGLRAIDELLRLVAPGGQVALLLHHREGGIYRQCAASLDAVEKLIAAEFMPRTIAMFRAGFAMCRGGERGPFEAASQQFMPALRTMESVLKRHGQHVADGTILGLYRDVRSMHERMANYDAAEVLEWLEKMEGELQAYAGRMASMCDAALDKHAFDAMRKKIASTGFKLLRDDALRVPDRDAVLAWALIATRT